MARISRDNLVCAAIKGVKLAFGSYGKWSGGEWLCRAPESFIQFQVAQQFSKISSCRVTLEDTVRYLRREAGAEMRGRCPRNSPSGRIDIVLWRKDGRPICLCEIKKAYQRSSLDGDVQRLTQMVSQESTIHTGLIVAYTAAKNKTKIESRFDGYGKRNYCSGGEQFITECKGWHWGVACFVVKG